MANVRAVLGRLEKVRRSGDGWAARCPAHDDDEPSLSVAEGRDGRVLLHCFAGCSAEDVARALDLDLSDLGPETSDAGVYTLYDYAAEKNLPAAELRRWGVRTVERDRGSVLAIPYRSGNGDVVGVKLRAGSSFWWDEHAGLPYGLDRLAEADEGRSVLLVEGESDCHVCWHHDVLALGVPGANSWRSEWGALLEDREVYVWREPDQGGEEFVEAVTADLPDARVIEAPEDAEDPADLHRRDPDTFRERLADLAAEAVRDDDLSGVRLINMADWLENPDALAPPEPHVPGLLYAGHTTLLFAHPKMGKTTTAVSAAAAVSRGRPWLSRPTREGAVLYLAAEGDPDGLLRLFHKFNARPPAVDLVVPGRDPVTELRVLLEHRSYRVVVVDTLGKWMTPLDVDRWKQAEVDTVLSPLERTIRTSGASLLALHHANADGRPIDSTGFEAWADVLRKLEEGEGERERIVTDRSRLDDVPDLRFRFREDDDRRRMISVDPDRDVEERVLAFIESNPGCSKRAIRENVSGSNSEIDEAVESLIGAGLVECDRSGRSHSHWIAENTEGRGTGTVQTRLRHGDAGTRGGDRASDGPPHPYRDGGPPGTPAGPADSDEDAEEGEDGHEAERSEEDDEVTF